VRVKVRMRMIIRVEDYAGRREYVVSARIPATRCSSVSGVQASGKWRTGEP
jgi:hypothetical protein